MPFPELASTPYFIRVLTIRSLTFRGSQTQGFISVCLTWQVCAQILILIVVLCTQGFKSMCLTWQVCDQMLTLIVQSYDQGSVLIVNFTSSGYPLLRCWYWPYNLTSMLNPCPNVYTDGKTLHLGVCAHMLISIVNAFVASSGLRLVSYI